MKNEEYNEMYFFWDCLDDFFGAANVRGLVNTDESYENEKMHSYFWKIASFWLNSEELKKQWGMMYEQWSNAVTWECFYSGLYLEMCLLNSENVEEVCSKIINSEIDPIFIIDDYTDIFNLSELSSFVFYLNELGMEYRKPYIGSQENAKYVLNSFLAIMHIGSAIADYVIKKHN